VLLEYTSSEGGSMTVFKNQRKIGEVAVGLPVGLRACVDLMYEGDKLVLRRGLPPPGQDGSEASAQSSHSASSSIPSSHAAMQASPKPAQPQPAPEPAEDPEPLRAQEVATSDRGGPQCHPDLDIAADGETVSKSRGGMAYRTAVWPTVWSAGSHYFEVEILSGSDIQVGLCTADAAIDGVGVSTTKLGWSWRPSDGHRHIPEPAERRTWRTPRSAQANDGDTIGVLLEYTSSEGGSMTVFKNQRKIGEVAVGLPVGLRACVDLMYEGDKLVLRHGLPIPAS
jgi:hypothetical protein